jgi:uncharacterized membrane protein AbrB (regulator of aidB expression)
MLVRISLLSLALMLGPRLKWIILVKISRTAEALGQPVVLVMIAVHLRPQQLDQLSPNHVKEIFIIFQII